MIGGGNNPGVKLSFYEGLTTGRQKVLGRLYSYRANIGEAVEGETNEPVVLTQVRDAVVELHSPDRTWSIGNTAPSESHDGGRLVNAISDILGLLGVPSSTITNTFGNLRAGVFVDGDMYDTTINVRTAYYDSLPIEASADVGVPLEFQVLGYTGNDTFEMIGYLRYRVTTEPTPNIFSTYYAFSGDAIIEETL